MVPLEPSIGCLSRTSSRLRFLAFGDQWHWVWRRGTGFIRDWNNPRSLRITGDVMLRRKVACKFPKGQEKHKVQDPTNENGMSIPYTFTDT